MALFSLLNAPVGGAVNLNEWSFAHMQDHLEIIQAIQKKRGINLIRYQLDPFNEHDVNRWLNRHQQSHDDFNSVLGLNGVDLQTTDFKDDKDIQSWTHLNFMEHRSARLALAI